MAKDFLGKEINMKVFYIFCAIVGEVCGMCWILWSMFCLVFEPPMLQLIPFMILFIIWTGITYGSHAYLVSTYSEEVEEEDKDNDEVICSF
jgi:hypothetical protein